MDANGCFLPSCIFWYTFLCVQQKKFIKMLIHLSVSKCCWVFFNFAWTFPLTCCIDLLKQLPKQDVRMWATIVYCVAWSSTNYVGILYLERVNWNAAKCVSPTHIKTFNYTIMPLMPSFLISYIYFFPICVCMKTQEVLTKRFLIYKNIKRSISLKEKIVWNLMT